MSALFSFSSDLTRMKKDFYKGQMWSFGFRIFFSHNTEFSWKNAIFVLFLNFGSKLQAYPRQNTTSEGDFRGPSVKNVRGVPLVVWVNVISASLR